MSQNPKNGYQADDLSVEPQVSFGDTKESNHILEFPCDFPIKIMGLARVDFVEKITDTVKEIATDYDPNTAEIRFSAEKKYISVTCTVNAKSKEQLNQLYETLTKHPLVKVVL
jgi:putative lipoic acid-binding regulatory protein